jgi:hypothetical protein
VFLARSIQESNPAISCSLSMKLFIDNEHDDIPARVVDLLTGAQDHILQ